MKLNSGQRLRDPVGSEDESESQSSACGGHTEQQSEGPTEKQGGEVLWAKLSQMQLKPRGSLDLANMELHVVLGHENSSVFV